MDFLKKVSFQPKLITSLKGYNMARFKDDVIAGIVVGIVALPLAVAFGIASGVTPTVGLITAVIGGFLVSALGGCSVQIGGPTGAFIVIIYGIIQQFGLTGLAIATVLAGLILVALGLFRLGTVIKFIPYPIVIRYRRDNLLNTDNRLLRTSDRRAASRFHLEMGRIYDSFRHDTPAYANRGHRIAGDNHCRALRVEASARRAARHNCGDSRGVGHARILRT